MYIDSHLLHQPLASRRASRCATHPSKTPRRLKGSPSGEISLARGSTDLYGWTGGRVLRRYSLLRIFSLAQSNLDYDQLRVSD